MSRSVALNLDRIRELMMSDDEKLPPITAAQALDAYRLMAASRTPRQVKPGSRSV